MYEYVRGALQEKTPEYVVVDVNGLGYRCYTPLSTFAHLPPQNEEVLLYTSFIVREDSDTLYGFLTKHERELFEMVLSVSGIGPKTALALVGHLDIPVFQAAIQDENIPMISKVPGIGKKTASRLIVEMRDKTGHIEKLRVDAHLGDVDTLTLDATLALVNLGYKQEQAKKAVQKVRKDHSSLNTLIPSALQNI